MLKTVKDHFQKVYNIKSAWIQQSLTKSSKDQFNWSWCASEFGNQQKTDRATGDSNIPVEFWQVLSDDICTENLFHEIVVKVWKPREFDEDWLSNRLKLLPKKRWFETARPLVWNQLIESPVKVIGSILANRISVYILESEGLEERNGFTSQRLL